MRSVFTGILLMLLSTYGYSDSDGYFCAGDGYLAVEFRSFNTLGIAGVHVLKVATFDEVLGPRWIGEISMEDFQVHLIHCHDSEILVEGVGEPEMGLLRYVVELGASKELTTTSFTSDPQYIFSSRMEPKNLGNWAREGVTVLTSSASTHSFELRVTRTTERVSSLLIHHLMESRLVEIDEKGQIVRELLLNSGTQIETIH